MLFKPSIKKVLAARGYRHCRNDDEFSLHGEYARNLQYAFSKEFAGPHEKIVDIIFLAADMLDEKVVIGFLRENVSVKNGVICDESTAIPFADFSLKELERQLNRLIPAGNPLPSDSDRHSRF